MNTQLPGGPVKTGRRQPVTLSEQTLRRIYNEYLEMPGLRLTLKQAQRLWGLDEDTCASSLSFLVDVNFLTHDKQVYTRASDGTVERPPFRMAKVEDFRNERAMKREQRRPAR
jgi:hypothetical protein